MYRSLTLLFVFPKPTFLHTFQSHSNLGSDVLMTNLLFNLTLVYTVASHHTTELSMRRLGFPEDYLMRVGRWGVITQQPRRTPDNIASLPV